MRRLGRLKLSLAFFACVLGSALASGPAAAQGPQDPQTTNIPYLAWRGEEIRLVKCDPAIGELPAKRVDWVVEEWTGPGLKPEIETSTITGFENCVAADVVSLDPGLARIQLVVSNPAGTPILKHQFLSIWMSLNTPSIDEVGSADPTGDPRLGDPLGDGIFKAGGSNGRIQVNVTGTFPHPLGPGGSFTLPNAWPDLAKALANDSDSNPDNNAQRWDIHDDLTKFSKHVPGYCTTEVDPTTTQDAVDNCNAGSDPYSDRSRASSATRRGQPVCRAVRPAGAQHAAERRQAERGRCTDARGSRGRSDRQEHRRHGHRRSGLPGAGRQDGGVQPEHRWAARLPTTTTRRSTGRTSRPRLGPGSRPGSTGRRRGTISAASWSTGSTTYWDFAEVLRSEVARPTTCLRRNDEAPIYRLTPAGAQNVAVYTDEHGEAQVEYNPGTGAFYDALAGIRNANGGCDLEDVDVLGTSSITATARYPYKGVSDTDKASTPLTKQVKSLFTKYLGVFPKGPGDANSNARIVVAHAQDVDGRAFQNERVCFNVDSKADGVFGYSGSPDAHADDRWRAGSAEGQERRVPAHGRQRQRCRRGPEQRSRGDQRDRGLRPRGRAPQHRR